MFDQALDGRETAIAGDKDNRSWRIFLQDEFPRRTFDVNGIGSLQGIEHMCRKCVSLGLEDMKLQISVIARAAVITSYSIHYTKLYEPIPMFP